MTIGERIWLMACTTFTAGVMLYNVVTDGNIFG